MKNTLVNKLQQWFFCRFVNYYDNGFYDFKFADGKLQLEPVKKSKALITIYARPHYQEAVVKLPTTDKKQIKKILVAKREAVARDSIMLAGDIVVSGNQASINSWIYATTLPSSWIMLPETLLLAKSQSFYEVCDYSVGKAFYCALFSGLCFSGFKTSLISSHDRFAHSVGVSFEQTNTIELESTRNTLLLKGLKSEITNLPLFINKGHGVSLTKDLQSYGMIFGALFAIYLFVSSAFLAFYGVHLEGRLEGQKESVDTALNAINRFERGKLQLEERVALFANFDILSPTVKVIDALSQVSEVQSMEKSDSRIIIRGVAPSALAVLESLQQLDNVSDARFDFPIRNSGSQEQFVASFILDTSSAKVKLGEQW
ncbi:hypothetical protein BB427_01875 [Pseudoalteromonas sp. BMB]|uniref:hypothetical protein n=1 Tax=Pseudoalteromonas sp. BMB TaxID=1874619 RepID=UPI00083D3EF4|nr:hypothetical protein [Pseudoalteromonas sp. BMB]ODB36785.1 hypothetical protein BB427_01875 [Pseudoalteromonas sp. BMB]